MSVQKIVSASNLGTPFELGTRVSGKITIDGTKFLTAGANITLTQDPTTGTITIAGAAGGGGGAVYTASYGCQAVGNDIQSTLGKGVRPTLTL